LCLKFRPSEGFVVRRESVDEIIACLPRERTHFTYFPQRYAPLLLARVLREDTDIARVRRSRFGALLNKPVMKAVLAGCGDGRLSPERCEYHWEHEQSRHFLLGLTGYGGRACWRYGQRTRRGASLVLQLNLNAGDMREVERLALEPDEFNYYGHPTSRRHHRRYRTTLAWARMDLDFATNEVLIEEVQSDFVRLLREYIDGLPTKRTPAPLVALLRALAAIWQEAMLSATLEFVWQELGIDTVYYHEWTTGTALKGIRYEKPPRSVYDALPRRFCMALTDEVPAFVRADRASRRRLRAVTRPRFFRLDRREGPCLTQVPAQRCAG
jgi:uncharacterized membrane protein YidH (DUF202 family)